MNRDLLSCVVLLGATPVSMGQPANPTSSTAIKQDLSDGVVFASLAAPSNAAPITSALRVDVSAQSDDGARLQTVDWDAVFPEELEVEEVRESARGSLGSNGAAYTTYSIELIPLTAGEFRIEPFDLVFTTPDGEHTVTTEAFTLTVESVLDGTDAQLADIKDPLDPPPDYLKIGLFVGGGVLAAALLAAGLAVIARRRPEAPPPPPVPAHVTAIEELDALLASDLIERKRWKPYFGDLSAILRRYIEKRFALHAPTQTTEEFLRDPRTRTMFEPSHDALVRGFLGQADMIKFAEGAMDSAAAREAADRVRAFVEETGVHSAHEDEEAMA